MLLELTPDQEFFRETTARFLDDQAPVDAVRGLRDDAAGFAADYWRRGAELGWTSLLVGEAAGGGTISGRAVVDLTLVAFEFGRHAAPGPLVACNIVAAALNDTGSHPDVLAALLSGEAIASWAYAEGSGRLGDVALDVRADGSDLVLNGVKRPVESAAQAQSLLVTGRSGEGLVQVLVPTDTPGLSVAPLRSVDLTRRFAAVTFEDVRVPAGAVVGAADADHARGGAGAQVARQLDLALVMLCAESVGAMQRGFDMTVEWALDRYTFGRPLASYQALKHRFADMKTWLEASHAVSDSAAAAVEARSPDASELASVAKAFIGDYGAELLQDCVQLHGGIGLTYEHDLHLFLRRLSVDRALFGTPAQHRQRITDFLQQEEAA
ncbi:MAG TPA: acyl-CoA dehydrogenase family protein [Acidimicrobiales bacterium]|nr:acyl-CoA dehydrogenase family protein [Acidimicrobiales bacterium]